MSFRIPCLGSCHLSIGRKLSLIILARYAISGQTDTETDFSSRYGFVRIRFQINHYSYSEKDANFIHRRGAID